MRSGEELRGEKRGGDTVKEMGREKVLRGDEMWREQQ